MTKIIPQGLTAELCAKIDAWILRYPPERKASGVMQALHYVQEANQGSLQPALLDAVADYLEMPRSVVYEVATFYTLYFMKPMGKTVISVCTNISCMLQGAEDLLAHFKKSLNIEVGETTPDGRWSLCEVECLGACVGAPVVQVGKRYYECLKSEGVDALLLALGKDCHGK